MGECYYHGTEIYPGHECPECEKKRPLNIAEIRDFGYRGIKEILSKEDAK